MKYIIMTIVHYLAIGAAWRLFQVITLGNVVPVDGLQISLAMLLSVLLTLLFFQHNIIKTLTWKLMSLEKDENQK